MNSPFGQELCNHRNHWKWYDGRVYHHRWYHEELCSNGRGIFMNENTKFFIFCFFKLKFKFFQGDIKYL
jgi:hypothetical protein